jgi:hypothetical protein
MEIGKTLLRCAGIFEWGFTLDYRQLSEIISFSQSVCEH